MTLHEGHGGVRFDPDSVPRLRLDDGSGGMLALILNTIELKTAEVDSG